MKKITLIIIAIALSSTTLAQKRYITNGFSGNWFITPGAGIQMPFNGTSSVRNFREQITPEFDLSVGKWVTPSLALRLQGGGYYSKWTPSIDGYSFIDRVNSWNLHGDVMFNLSAIIGGYRSNRFYEAVPYVGVGMINNMDIKNSYATQLTLNAGLVNKLRVSRLIDIIVEIKGLMTTDNLRSYGTPVQYGPLVAATAGISFKLGRKRTFTKYTPAPTVDLQPYKSRINSLEKSVNESKVAQQQLSERIAILENDINNAPPKQEVVTKEEIIVPDMTLFYSLGSSVLSDKELVNLREIGKVIKQTPTLKYRIVGLVDYSTGSVALNKKLCDERVDFVYYQLISNGVNPNQLVRITSDPSSPFHDPSLNRAVVIKVVK